MSAPAAKAWPEHTGDLALSLETVSEPVLKYYTRTRLFEYQGLINRYMIDVRIGFWKEIQKLIKTKLSSHNLYIHDPSPSLINTQGNVSAILSDTPLTTHQDNLIFEIQYS